MRYDRPGQVLEWAVEMFGPIAEDREERALRFVEEAIELGHAMGLSVMTTRAIIDRVYDRPAGGVAREIGQSQLTLEALAEVMGRTANDEADIEFTRVKAIPKEVWAGRHEAKQKLGIAK